VGKFAKTIEERRNTIRNRREKRNPRARTNHTVSGEGETKSIAEEESWRKIGGS